MYLKATWWADDWGHGPGMDMAAGYGCGYWHGGWPDPEYVAWMQSGIWCLSVWVKLRSGASLLLPCQFFRSLLVTFPVAMMIPQTFFPWGWNHQQEENDSMLAPKMPPMPRLCGCYATPMHDSCTHTHRYCIQKPNNMQVNVHTPIHQWTLSPKDAAKCDDSTSEVPGSGHAGPCGEGWCN